MKNFIFLLFIFISQISIGQTKANTIDSIIVKVDNTKIEQLTRENNELKENINNINEKLIDISFFKEHLVFGFFLGLIIGLAILYFGVRDYIRFKLGKMTGIEFEIISRNLKQFDKHNKLRKNTKIAILSKDDEYNERFSKLMGLFNVNISNPHQMFVLDMHDFESNYKTFEQLDILIIENLYKDVWDMNNENVKNAFVNLAMSITHHTSILYYGGTDNKFPIGEIEDSEKVDLISFANASSQLYSNLLNMMKYRDEMGLNIICK